MTKATESPPAAALYRNTAGQLRAAAKSANRPQPYFDAALEFECRAAIAELDRDRPANTFEKIAKKIATFAAIVVGVTLLSIAW